MPQIRMPMRSRAIAARSAHMTTAEQGGRLLVGAVALVVSACGSGGGDGSSNSSSGGGSSDGGLVTGAASGDASTVDTDVLRRTAARGAARGLGPNLRALPGFISNDTDTDEGAAGANSALGDTQDAGEQLLATLLGIDDPNAVVTRDGNLITVDPDDASICASSDDVVGATGIENDETEACLQLVADLTVALDAQSETTGVINYLFQGTPVVALGYSPDTGNTELNFGGLKLVLERLAIIEASSGLSSNGPGDDSTDMNVPDVMRGVMRLSSRVDDDLDGSESGEITLNVSETLEISDASGFGLTLQPSRVLQLAFDATTESVSLSLDWGALQLVTEARDDTGNTSRTTVNLGGLSLDVGTTGNTTSETAGGTPDETPTLSLRNVGIGGLDAPLNIRIDDQQALSVALETFDASINPGTGDITFDTPASVAFALDNLSGLFEEYASEYTASFTAAIPGGTVLAPRDDDLTEIRAGGPVTASFIASDNNTNVQADMNAGVGACFGSADSSGTLSEPAAGYAGDSSDDDDDDPLDGLRLTGAPCP